MQLYDYDATNDVNDDHNDADDHNDHDVDDDADDNIGLEHGGEKVQPSVYDSINDVNDDADDYDDDASDNIWLEHGSMEGKKGAAICRHCSRPEVGRRIRTGELPPDDDDDDDELHLFPLRMFC